MQRTLKLWKDMRVQSLALMAACGVHAAADAAVLASSDADPAKNQNGSASKRLRAQEGGERGSAKLSSSKGGYAGGSFDASLALVLGGEGGNGGAGMLPLRKEGREWYVRIPTLSGSQIAKAVAGNSLRSEREFALGFTGHSYQGWSLTWSKAAMASCPTHSGPEYGIFDKECYVAKESRYSGIWTTRNDRLCFAPAPFGITHGEGCVKVAMALNSLLFFGSDGRLLGKGGELLPGSNASRDRAPPAAD